MTAMPDIIERLATCARKLLEAGAEIEHLLAEKTELIALCSRAVALLANARSNYVAGCEYDAQWDAGRDALLAECESLAFALNLIPNPDKGPENDDGLDGF